MKNNGNGHIAQCMTCRHWCGFGWASEAGMCGNMGSSLYGRGTDMRDTCEAWKPLCVYDNERERAIDGQIEVEA